MAHITSVCVYCGSGSGTNPLHAETARILGRALAEGGIRLIYGGGSVGLMGTVARSVLDAGGAVTGIIPGFLKNREKAFTDLTELVVTETMHERKMLMFEQADAFVALPGGVGTLEELVEQLTWAQLGRHEKPVLLANIAGFWNPFLAQLDVMTREGFIRAGLDVGYLVADRAEDIVPTLVRAADMLPGKTPQPVAATGPIARM